MQKTWLSQVVPLEVRAHKTSWSILITGCPIDGPLLEMSVVTGITLMYLFLDLVKVQKLHTSLAQTNHGFSTLILRLDWWDHLQVWSTYNNFCSCGGTFSVPLYIPACPQTW
jgi:hypothetical protein